MKKYLKNVLIISGILFMSTGLSIAQKGVEDGSKFGHGEDSIRCLKNLSLYREYAKQNAFKDAYPFWKIVFEECPTSSKNIYYDGVKIYKSFIESENNPTHLNELIDTLMLIYDRRIEYYPRDKGNVRERQATDLLRYKRDEIEAKLQAYGYLKEAIEIRGEKTHEATIAQFSTASISLYQDGKFTPEEVINDYEIVSNLLEKMIADDPDIQETKDQIDENMVASGVLDCETLIKFFTPKFEASPNDIALLTKLTDFLDKLDCRESDLFYKALTNRHKIEPSSSSSKMLAVLNFQRENYAEANKYYLEAVEKETDNDKKSDIYLGLAQSVEKTGDKPQARTYALKAAELKPNSGEPYLFIGNLYATSEKDCGNIDLPKRIYWAAVDMFIKAKKVDPSIADRVNPRIEAYTNYFPNKEEAFFFGIKEGDSVTVGCWINEKTTARF